MKTKTKGLITQACLHEIVKFGEDVRLGEHRNDILPTIARRWPPKDFSDASGLAFGVYADYLSTADNGYLARAGNHKFFLHIHQDELDKLEIGCLRLDIDNKSWIYLSPHNIMLEIHQGPAIPFTAKWVRKKI